MLNSSNAGMGLQEGYLMFSPMGGGGLVCSTLGVFICRNSKIFYHINNVGDVDERRVEFERLGRVQHDGQEAEEGQRPQEPSREIAVDPNDLAALGGLIRGAVVGVVIA